MKIFFNTGIQQTNKYVQKNKNCVNNNTYQDVNINYMMLQALSNANMSNISFGMCEDARFLLNQTDYLVCAYSGKDMISPQLAKKILDKLDKKPNLQSAVNYLIQYQTKYMHDIESQIFDIFNDKEIRKYYGNKTFTDVLNDYKPDALLRLKDKQLTILTSTDKLIEKLSEPVKEIVKIIRDDSIKKTHDDTFGRRSPLERLTRIKTTDKDTGILRCIYSKWYKLPSSSSDIDAFIVSYSKMSHKQIAQRLINSAFATIEHIKPKSKNGSDNLANYLLVSAEYNNARSSLPLYEFIELRDDINIKNNLQIYIDCIKREIKGRNEAFIQHPEYLFEVVQTIEKETAGKVKLDTTGVNIPQEIINYRINTSHKLGKKYTVR